MTEQIVLGSGDLYITDYTGTIPTDELIETDENLIGRIKGGASLEYKPTEYEVSDDGFHITKRFVINEETTFKSGILTWNLEVLSKLIANGTYADSPETHIRTLKLGGNGARLMKNYLIHFVHTTSDGQKVRITLIGTASAGFSLNFNPEQETVIDAEFKALGDQNGIQVILTETYQAI